ncbi:hypothetical protein [Pedobacter sp. NJ-S-72]
MLTTKNPALHANVIIHLSTPNQAPKIGITLIGTTAKKIHSLSTSNASSL